MIAVAASYGVSFSGLYDLPQTCRLCRKDGSPTLRADWGCDGPTSQPQLFIPCVRCDGTNELCALCEGQGFEAIHRCPYANDIGEAQEFLLLHAAWPGTLPMAGGIYDQPAIYVDAMRLLDVATQRILGELRKKQELKNART